MIPAKQRCSDCSRGTAGTCTRGRNKENGVVLIVSIVLLAIVSILAAYSTRNAASAENLSGNVRLTELATQAAEIALRHCERSVVEVMAVAGGALPSGFDTFSFTDSNILSAGSDAIWRSPAEWDKPASVAYVLPLALVNQADLPTTYKRPPECMVVRVPFRLPSGVMSPDVAFLVTARGFGPDVAAADPDRTRPVGAEVWLQSHIELE